MGNDSIYMLSVLMRQKNKDNLLIEHVHKYNTTKNITTCVYIKILALNVDALFSKVHLNNMTIQMKSK